MAIVQDPLFIPASGYRPIEWISSTSINVVTTGTVTIATAIVTLDGVQVAIITKRVALMNLRAWPCFYLWV